MEPTKARQALDERASAKPCDKTKRIRLLMNALLVSTYQALHERASAHPCKALVTTKTNGAVACAKAQRANGVGGSIGERVAAVESVLESLSGVLLLMDRVANPE